jgi:hypothetical protein
MSTIHVTGDAVEIHLSPAEKIGALHGDLRVPRRAIRAAEVVEDGLAATCGLRAPGLAIPGRVKIGTWRGRRATLFVAVRRGEPALRLALYEQRYDTVLVSTPAAAALAAELQPPDRTPG